MKTLKKCLSVFLLGTSAAMASPGAHGPNGEHLDAAGAAQAQGMSVPRVETYTKSFELVGQVQGGELSILVDRYDTNEPVLNGKLEVAAHGLKAPAKFHADHGDYSVDDAPFLKALAAPGKHALVFTLAAGNESDVLEGVLEVRPADRSHHHPDDRARLPTSWIVAGGLLALALTVLSIRLLRRQSPTGK